MIAPRAAMLTVAIVATLAGGGGAAASWGDDPAATEGATEIVIEASAFPMMDLPNGCAGDGWESEGSID